MGLCHPGQRPAPRGAVRAHEHDGRLGRLLSQLSVGRFADWRKSLGYTGRAQWDPALYIYVAIALIGMVLWALINPEKTVDSQKPKPTGSDAGLA